MTRKPCSSQVQRSKTSRRHSFSWMFVAILVIIYRLFFIKAFKVRSELHAQSLNFRYKSLIKSPIIRVHSKKCQVLKMKNNPMTSDLIESFFNDVETYPMKSDDDNEIEDIPRIPKNGMYYELNRGMKIDYFKNVLKLSESGLAHVISSRLLYLNIETNIKPKIEVFKSFGFSMENIRNIVESYPSVLYFNADVTLPKKIQTIKEIYRLSGESLIRFIVKQPTMIVNSIEHNIKTAAFLKEVIGMSIVKLKKLIDSHPNIISSGVKIIERCWLILTEVYKINKKDASLLCIRNPSLLTETVVTGGLARIDFFKSCLGFEIPSENLRKIILQCPHLLHLSADYFLKQNALTLAKYLDLDGDNLKKIITVFPKLLKYNPIRFQDRCRESIYYLTSNSLYRTSNIAKDIDDIAIHIGLSDDSTDFDIMSLDAFNEMPLRAASSTSNLEVINSLYIMTSSLSFNVTESQKIIRTNPWWLAFRPERRRKTLLMLAFTLGMTKAEIERCIRIYPRVVCLSCEGKLPDLLVLLSKLAMLYLKSPKHNKDIKQILAEQNTHNSFEYLQNVSYHTMISLQQRRSDPVRTLVRYCILKSPLILGTSISRIIERTEELFVQIINGNRVRLLCPSLQWSKLPTHITINKKEHDRRMRVLYGDANRNESYSAN